MKKTLSVFLAAILCACAVSCAVPTTPASSASSETERYEAYLAERGCLPDSLIIGNADDSKKYGVDMTAFADDGYFTRAENGNVVILAKSDDGLDRAVRDYAKHGNSDDYFKTYNEGYRVKRLTVCGNDISQYCVIRPDGADECLTFAASELVKYVGLTCGAQIPGYTESEYAALRSKPEHKITLSVDHPALGDEGFTISVAECGDVAILGGRYRGCMYGVYGLLENVGWRFVNDPDTREHTTHEYLYEADAVDITPSVNRTENSTFAMRKLSDSGALNKNTDELTVKVRGNSQNDPKYGSFGLYRAACHGLDNARCLENAGLYGGLKKEGHQPCFTDPDIADCVTEYVLSTISDRLAAGETVGKELTVIDISQYDSELFCECKRCKAVFKEEGSQAGAVVRMTNTVAEAVAEECPGVYVAMFAYAGTDIPPQKARPLDNVRVSFCFHIGNGRMSCGRHSVSGLECDPYSAYSNYTFGNELREWLSIMPAEHMDVWYYPFTAGANALCAPVFTALYDSLRYLAETGISGIYVCSCGQKDDLAEYLCAKMAWNADITRDEYDALIYEWLNINYGESADLMLEYMTICENAGQRAPGCWCAFHGGTDKKIDIEWFADRFDHMWDMFAEAKKMADTTHQEELIEEAESGMLYVCIGATHTERYINGSEAEREEFAERYREYHRIFTKYGLRIYNDLINKVKVPETFDPQVNPFDTGWQNGLIY